MKIQIGDTVKVKGSKTGRHFKIVDLMGDLVLGSPDGSTIKIGLDPLNLVVVGKR